jgi:formiminotetrahydrofolate cyclodeaminase
MAARYTTGPKWGAAGERAQLLAETLDAAASALIDLADEDAAAFAAMQAARKEKVAEAIAVAEQRAATVPASLIEICGRHAEALRVFLSVSNPHLVSDVKVGIHLLAGAGRAAWQTLLINQPPVELQTAAQTHLETLDRCERAALGGLG